MDDFSLKKIKKNNLVTQSNNLVEARYSLSLYEQRLVLMMISMVEPQDEDFKDYKIRVSDFNQILGLKHKGSYSKIKSILRGLRAKELLINKGEKDYLVTGWVSDAEYKDKEGYVLLSFSKIYSISGSTFSIMKSIIIKFCSFFDFSIFIKPCLLLLNSYYTYSFQRSLKSRN